ncbi:MAG: lysyl-tRNA synthetase class II, partial [Halothiobacillaceae bacterium]
LVQRAAVIQKIRRFFAERQVLEVETPILGAASATDPHIESLTTRYAVGTADDALFYLQTSPEFAMKRLLAAGSGDIFQISRVFRNGELGRLHNPEFTLLEWYRVGFDLHHLMDEVDQFLRKIAATGEAERLSYAEAFTRFTGGINPHTATLAELRCCVESQGIRLSESCVTYQRDEWLDLIISQLVSPHLGRGCPTFIYDFPASQAALARIRPGEVAVAERFEVFIDGIEIANGYYELLDPVEQQRRFQYDNRQREAMGLAPVVEDQALLAALQAGMPACAGVAIGVDRLLMGISGVSSIAEVIAFPLDRA